MSEVSGVTMIKELPYSTRGRVGVAEVETVEFEVERFRFNPCNVWTNPLYGMSGIHPIDKPVTSYRVPGALATHWVELPTGVVTSCHDLKLYNHTVERMYALMPGSPGCELRMDTTGLVTVIGEPVAQERTIEVFIGDGLFPEEEFQQELLRRKVAEGIQTEGGAVMWFSWSAFGKDVTPEKIYAQLPYLEQLGVKWVIVDDGWQRMYGDWKGNSRFKNMAEVFTRLREAGVNPGVWIAPFGVSKDSAAFAEFEALGLVLTNKGEYPSLDRLVPAGMHAGLDVRDERVRLWAMKQIQELVEQGAELLKIDFLNLTTVGDTVHPEVTVADSLRRFITDLRVWLRSSGHENVKLYLCGGLDLAGLSDFSRVSTDPVDPPPQSSVLRWLKNRSSELSSKDYLRLLGYMNSTPLTRRWLEKQVGLSVDEMKRHVAMIGELNGLCVDQIRQHVGVFEHRFHWSTVAVAEPMIRADGVPQSIRNEVSMDLSFAIAQGWVGALCLGDDLPTLSDQGLSRLDRITRLLREKYSKK